MSNETLPELQTRLEQLEHQYAAKFTGLSNWSHLNRLWQAIKQVREEIETERSRESDPASSPSQPRQSR